MARSLGVAFIFAAVLLALTQDSGVAAEAVEAPKITTDVLFNGCTDTMTKLLKQKAALLDLLGFSTAKEEDGAAEEAAGGDSTGGAEEGNGSTGGNSELGSAKFSPKQIHAIKKFQKQVAAAQAHFGSGLAKQRALRKRALGKRALGEASSKHSNGQRVVELGESYDEEEEDEVQQIDGEADHNEDEEDEEEEEEATTSAVATAPKKSDKEEATKPPEPKLPEPEVIHEKSEKATLELFSMCVDNLAKLGDHLSHLLQGNDPKQGSKGKDGAASGGSASNEGGNEGGDEQAEEEAAGSEGGAATEGGGASEGGSAGAPAI